MRLAIPALMLTLATQACDRSPSVTDGPTLSPPSPAEAAIIARSSNALGFDVYAKTRTAQGNRAISPASMTAALTMTWAGARGETAEQMAKVLHAETSAERALEISGKLFASYRAPQRLVLLRIANRLFGERTYPFERHFLDITRASFGAPLEPLDFQGDAEGGRRRINAWVAGETQRRIQNLVPVGTLDAQTRLILTNAIYFLGNWETPFKKESTYPEAFHTTATEVKTVRTMHQAESFRFATDGQVKILELPYQGGDLAMTLVLPEAVDGLGAIEQGLTTAKADAWFGALRIERVFVALPRFEIAPAESLSLDGALCDLGMTLAFDRERADFSGMANPPKPEDRLRVSHIFHKAFVKLDEKGTEAAAASAVEMAAESAAAAPKTPEFRADHPFLFFLRDLRSGMILFMGRVTDPASK